jgi:hypothetical protein
MGPRGFPPYMSHDPMFQISSQSVEINPKLLVRQCRVPYFGINGGEGK